jgi:hypothetical protein|tara:strand:- start:220 stop:540 length:321 start_codon:yes stop_codon:yes gene_type:complete
MENDMKIEFDTNDAKDLANTSCESFYFGREDEFETVSENIPQGNNKGKVMHFYDTRLEALLSCKAFKQNDPNTAMVWREVNYLIEGDDTSHSREEYIVITRGSLDG